MGEDYANEICNYFFKNCGAIIGKKDYDYVTETIKKIKKPIEEEETPTVVKWLNRQVKLGILKSWSRADISDNTKYVIIFNTKH